MGNKNSRRGDCGKTLIPNIAFFTIEPLPSLPSISRYSSVFISQICILAASTLVHLYRSI